MKAEASSELLARFEPAWGPSGPMPQRSGHRAMERMECATCGCSLRESATYFFADRRYCESHRRCAELPTDLLKRSLEAAEQERAAKRPCGAAVGSEPAVAGIVTPPGSSPDMHYRGFSGRPGDAPVARCESPTSRMRQLVNAFVVVDAMDMDFDR